MKYNETHGVDEFDACQVHVVLRILIDQFVIVDGLGLDVLVVLIR
jgi:hypothetical protein